MNNDHDKHMYRLCTTPIWDQNITRSSYPYLTDCFRDTVLQWIPMGIFYLSLPIWLYILVKQKLKSPPIPKSTLFVVKTVLTILFILIQIIRIVHYSILLTTERTFANILTPVLYIITALIVLWLMNYDRLNGLFSSGLLFNFWLLVCLASIPDVIQLSVTFRQQVKSATLWIELIIVCLHCLITSCLFISQCFAEQHVLPEMIFNERLVVPELYASFPSRIFFEWASPLIQRGYREPLTEKDCWELPISERTMTTVDQVESTLRRRTRNSIANKNLPVNNDKLPDSNQVEEEHQNLLHGLPVVDIKTPPGKPPTTPVFWHVLFRTYAAKLIAGGLLKLFHDLSQLAGPLILKLLLDFFMDRTKPKWLGIFYAILLSINVFFQIILMRAQFQNQFIIGIRFRSAITGLVFRKSLKLSNASRQETTTGEIVNLMAIDASRFADLCPHMHVLWSGPLQLVIALYLLYRQMQLAIVPGVGILLIMIPVNLYLQRVQKRLTTKQMTVKDQRIRTMNEVLNGIRVLKLYAWEMAFIRSITHIREQELTYIQQKAIISAVSNILWTFTPILVGITTFGTYVLSSDKNLLTPDKAFVALALFNLLRGPLVAFPNIINSVVEALVSNKRIQKFLNTDEVDEKAVEKVPLGSDGLSVKVENGAFRWSNRADDPLVLKNLNLRISQGALVGLVGVVGSGKSSILAALLGEMNKVHGRVCLSGNVAYVPQTAWIMNTTLKENILFGRDFDKDWYDRVVEACALKHDLDMLPARDQTEIGEKGINLSGGQRQRVSLARALYSNAEIYLLDDPLSAVDAHVGAHIFRHVIGSKGLLSEKTRLLVTHGVSHLRKFDDILVISQGEIVDQGSYVDLMNSSQILRDFVHSIATGDTEQYQRRTSGAESPKSVPATPLEFVSNPFEIAEKDIQPDESQLMSIEVEEEKTKIIEKETVQTGSVKLNIFSIYIRACKLLMVALILTFFCLTICALLSANIWLSKWTDKAKRNNTSDNTTSTNNQLFDMYIYSALGITQGFLAFAMQLIQKLAAYTAARKLHWIILIGVLHAPMSFFDTTPIGRIINRFARDIDSVDSTLPNAFSQTLTTIITVVATLIILIYGSWFAIIELIPLAILFGYIQRVYIASSRQLRRLDSVTRSLIFANFGGTVQGLDSIRAYHAQRRFTDVSDEFMDRNQSCHMASAVANRWLGVRLEMISNLLTLLTAITAVLMRDHLTPGTVGLMITYALQITNALNMLVRTTSEVETNIVSVERINEYAQLTPEAPWDIPETKPASQWPTSGTIQFADLSTRYRKNLQLVLKDLTLTIEPGEKIGIIGRTGSGKSSLCLVLFRIIEPSNGTIIIDNVDIRLIGLHDLRSKITIIPQDAVIFAGTVRFNVDPFGHYSDTEIWHALELVHLKERISIMDSNLQHQLAEGGQNMSAGERQLLCLARALLRKSKIFVLDEATAAIDMETDRLIQLTIRSAFKTATVITIAHRLHTILDSTRILVLSNGYLQEYDEPKRLAANPHSAFAKLLRDANIRPADIASTVSS